MNVFEFDDYIEALKVTMASKRLVQPSYTLSRVAELSNIQRTYLSHVLAGRAHLNQDQLFAICSVLEVTPTETEYLQILLEIDRCSFEPRKKILKEKQAQLRQSLTQSEKALARASSTQSEENLLLYFSDPICSIGNLSISQGNQSSGRPN